MKKNSIAKNFEGRRRIITLILFLVIIVGLFWVISTQLLITSSKNEENLIVINEHETDSHPTKETIFTPQEEKKQNIQPKNEQDNPTPPIKIIEKQKTTKKKAEKKIAEKRKQKQFFSHGIAKNIVRNFHKKFPKVNIPSDASFRAISGEVSNGFANTLMCWTTTLIFSYYSGFSPLVNFGMGGGMIKKRKDFTEYFPPKTVTFRLENENLNVSVNMKNFMSYRKQNRVLNNKKEERKIITLKILKGQAETTLMGNNIKKFFQGRPGLPLALQNISQSSTQWNQKSDQFFFTFFNRTFKKSGKRNEDFVMRYYSISFASYFIIYNKKALFHFCENLKLCEGVEAEYEFFKKKNEKELSEYFDHSLTHQRGIGTKQYYFGYRMAANIFNEMFELNSKLSVVLDDFINKNVPGLLVVFQIRTRFIYGWQQLVPGYAKWLECAQIIVDEYGKANEYISFYLSVDGSRGVNDFVNELSGLSGSDVKVNVLTAKNYFNKSVNTGKRDVENALKLSHDSFLSDIVALDFEIMKRSDVNVMSYGSTFGSFGMARNKDFYPPIVMLKEKKNRNSKKKIRGVKGEPYTAIRKCKF